MNHPIEKECSFLILGSMCAHPRDKSLDRNEINPVQLIHKGEHIPLHFFDKWGELGVSSMAWKTASPERIYISTGNDLKLLLLDKVEVVQYDIYGLKGMHEMSLIDELLWITNTGRDEVIAFNTIKNEVDTRINLGDLVNHINDKKGRRESIESSELFEMDKFHCNQLFQGIDGKVYLLVHHVSGRQVVKAITQKRMVNRIARKLLKKQGEGGVICIDNQRKINLNLKAPHSIRRVNQEYWIFDSGNAKLNIYDSSWNLKRDIETKGWGRGADQSCDGKYFIAGISETRKRYIVRNRVTAPNMVQIFSTTDYSMIHEIKVERIEQINNIYSVTDKQVELLLKLH